MSESFIVLCDLIEAIYNDEEVLKKYNYIDFEDYNYFGLKGLVRENVNIITNFELEKEWVGVLMYECINYNEIMFYDYIKNNDSFAGACQDQCSLQARRTAADGPTPTYIDYMRYNAQAIAAVLGETR